MNRVFFEWWKVSGWIQKLSRAIAHVGEWTTRSEWPAAVAQQCQIFRVATANT